MKLLESFHFPSFYTTAAMKQTSQVTKKPSNYKHYVLLTKPKQLKYANSTKEKEKVIA